MRNGSTVYFCKRTSSPDDSIETFAKPVAYILKPMYLTIQPTGGYLDVHEFGEASSITYRGMAIPYRQWEGVFSAGDRFYLNITPPIEEPDEGWGIMADAKITAVRPQNKAIELIIQDILR